jgi:DNA repair protein RadA/Sms
MASPKTVYTCNECGASSPRWLGKCPGCGAWNSLLESAAEATGGGGKNRLGSAFSALAPAAPVQRARPPALASWTACWAAASSKAAWC